MPARYIGMFLAERKVIHIADKHQSATGEDYAG